MKKTIKILIYLLTILILTITLFVSVLYYNKEKIISKIVLEANRFLVSKVEVGSINLSILESFPHISIVFHDVKVLESIPNSNKLLLSAYKLGASFNVWDYLKGKIVVNNIFAEKGLFHIRIDSSGRQNFNIFKKNTSYTDSKKSKINFNLNKITIEQFEILYSDEVKDQHLTMFASETKTSLNHSNEITQLIHQGEFSVHGFMMGNQSFFKNKPLKIKSNISFNNSSKILEIKTSEIKIEKSVFELSGRVHTDSSQYLQLKFEGVNTTISTILSLLSKNIYNKVKDYQSKGNVYFKGEINGSFAHGNTPDIRVLFGCQKASFSYPGLSKTLSNASFQGEYVQKNGLNVLTISNLNSTLDGKPISGNIILKDFRDPYLSFDISASFDTKSILGLYPIHEVDYLNGLIKLDLLFAGKINDLKTEKGKRNISASGEIEIKDFNFKLKGKKQLYEEFNANLLFNNNDVSINEFYGKIGKSDIKLDGMFKNLIPCLLLKNENLSISAKLSGQLLDLDDLLANQSENQNQVNEEYKLVISPWLNLDLKCDYEKIKFRRFNAKKIKGDLVLGKGIAKTNGIKMDIAGGNFKVVGLLDASNPHNIKALSNIDANSIEIDSIFYTFEDFGQKLITQKQISGNLTGNIALNVELDEYLNIIPSSILSDVKVRIKEGRLLNFEPMMQLSKFVNEDELKDIRFKEIENQFHIENEMIHIPDMTIKSNLNTVNVSGTHSFKNEMNYHLKISLKNYKKTKKPEEETAIEEDSKSGGTSLYLKIVGIPPHLKITYDSKVVKEKIKSRLKEEKTQFIELFKKETKEEKEKAIKHAEIDENNVLDFD